MTRPEQRETERRHIAMFLQLAGLAASSLEQGDAPDAVVTIGGRRVGLEHAELVQEDIATNKVNIDALVPLVTRRLASLGVRLHVRLTLSDASAPMFRKRRKLEEFAARVARLAKSHQANAALQTGGHSVRKHGLRHVVMFTLFPSDQPTASGLVVIRGHGVPGVRDAVKRKDAKIARYRENVDQVWLLLVTGEHWTQPTEWFLTRDLQIESAFDAVYLLDVRHKVVQALHGSR